MWLFDCGEGTQHQMLRAPFGPAKVDHILITHLHGDHIYGLPGLLGSRAFQSATSDVSIVGPKGIAAFVETSIRISCAHLPYQLRFLELDHDEPACRSRQVVYEDQDIVVTVAKLHHGIPSWGYRIDEKPSPGSLRTDVLKSLGVPPGPIYGTLKSGQDVTLDDGRVIRAADVVAPPRQGRSVVILGDTLPTDSAIELAEGADVLVHESTYDAADHDRAKRYHHTSADAAADIAKRAGVGQLVLTHISARYDADGEAQLLQDATDVFENTAIAHDHFRLAVKKPRRSTL